MRNTATISLTTLVFGFVAPIVLAILVNQVISRRRKRFTQTATYLPHFISIVVIVGMLQVFLSPSTGLITRFLGFFGVEGVNFLGSTEHLRAGVRDLRGLAALRVELHHLPRGAGQRGHPAVRGGAGSTAPAGSR